MPSSCQSGTDATLPCSHKSLTEPATALGSHFEMGSTRSHLESEIAINDTNHLAHELCSSIRSRRWGNRTLLI